MTCIAAVLKDNKIYMGCDSFVGDYYSHTLLPPTEHKMFTLDVKVVGGPAEKMIFGFAGALRPCQLIKHNLKAPLIDADDDLTEMQYLINKFIPAVKAIHRWNGNLLNKDGVESSESLFLLGWRNKLYYIGDDYCVLPGSTSYLALGSGQDVAYGSLKTTENTLYTPEERIKLALTAASQNTNYVREPFYIESI